MWKMIFLDVPCLKAVKHQVGQCQAVAKHLCHPSFCGVFCTVYTSLTTIGGFLFNWAYWNGIRAFGCERSLLLAVHLNQTVHEKKNKTKVSIPICIYLHNDIAIGDVSNWPTWFIFYIVCKCCIVNVLYPLTTKHCKNVIKVFTEFNILDRLWVLVGCWLWSLRCVRMQLFGPAQLAFIASISLMSAWCVTAFTVTDSLLHVFLKKNCCFRFSSKCNNLPFF